MHFALALAIAVSFWQARNVEIPCHPAAVVKPDAEMLINGVQASMATRGVFDCRVLISESTEFTRFLVPALYCTGVVHELGHIGGLSHTPTGIMAAKVPAKGDVPYDCRHWKRFERLLHPEPQPSTLAPVTSVSM